MFDDVRKSVEKIASKHKVEEYEMVLSRHDFTSFSIEQRDLTVSSEVGVSSLGLRLLKKGKLTYASTTVADEAALEHVISAALTNLQPTALKVFARIPTGLSWDDADEKITDLVTRPRRLRDLLSATVSETWERGNGKFERLNGNGGVGLAEEWVFTSGSAEPSYRRGTGFNAYIDLDSRDFEILVKTRLPKPREIETLGAKVARRLPKRSAKPSDLGLKGKETDVVLHPFCLASMFSNVIAEHIYATSKLSGLSRFKAGRKHASSVVTIADDGAYHEFISRGPTDEEGTKTRRNVLFDKGVFKTFAYDAETAVLDRTESTGNGMRRPVLAEESHEAPVRPTLRGLVMEPGGIKLKDMIKDVKKGIMLKFLLGIHTADKVSGSFSNTAYLSYVIENGKLTSTAEPGTWAMRGNALGLLKTIDAVSTERFLTGSSLLPWVKTRLYVG
ncbi:hypothetical protein GF359_10585 [candidate division WOR-3 bacterium]|uniref:TldD/PmbA family protein n=1 Tax=candidate division WOR-3 bacterium TaxID=2052148 RepID=A0A9D5KB52_UNCW3|nr:hypothetical protein [candidate division WOR-3 bacterium]MBD3365648.1 hypothetical protein [candidate division WOR-3 bacterium]